MSDKKRIEYLASYTDVNGKKKFLGGTPVKLNDNEVVKPADQSNQGYVCDEIVKREN